MDIFFNSADLKKIKRMSGLVTVVSTVCPDYSNDGTRYTFQGKLGSGISLTAQEHLKYVPIFLDGLRQLGLQSDWQILVADLPELTEDQREFWQRVAGSQEEYLLRCEQSTQSLRDLGYSARTFSQFYGEASIEYLIIQEGVAELILAEAETQDFSYKFFSFMMSRKELAEKFRGRGLSVEELRQAAAHGMSLYVTHGTLLRKVFLGKNLIVINHQTTNLQNFYLCNFVAGYENLIDTPKFPLGILKKELY